MRRNIITLLGIGILVLGIIVPAVAVPQKINFQGVLKDSLGEPVTGTKSITFKIYDVATGGTALWAETQVVSVEAGLYSVRLGDATSLSAGIFAGDTRYLGISIDGEELSPRTVMVSVPFAYRAAVADAYESGGITSDVVRFGVDPLTTQTTTGANAVRIATQGDSAKTLFASSEGENSRTILGTAWGQNSTAVVGLAYGGGGDSYGVFGRGYNEANIGVMGMTNVDQGYGVIGQAGGSGSHGLHGLASDPAGIGVHGWGGLCGVYGGGSKAGGSFEATGSPGLGVYAIATGTPGVGGYFMATPGNVAVIGYIDGTTGYAAAFNGGVGILIPQDSTASTPTPGTIRYNNSTDKFQGFVGGATNAWVNLH